MKINNKIRHQANKLIEKLIKDNGSCYFLTIPITEINDVLNTIGISIVQEDGTPFEGFLCGKNGRSILNLAMNNEIIDNSLLDLSWYLMPSNNYEITAYVS